MSVLWRPSALQHVIRIRDCWVHLVEVPRIEAVLHHSRTVDGHVALRLRGDVERVDRWIGIVRAGDNDGVANLVGRAGAVDDQTSGPVNAVLAGMAGDIADVEPVSTPLGLIGGPRIACVRILGGGRREVDIEADIAGAGRASGGAVEIA